MKIADYFWFHVARHMRRTSSFQIILISVTLHSVASIVLIYFHLRSFFEYEISHYEPKDLFSREGGIEFARRRQQLNLVTSREIDPADLTFGYRGWWSDHGKWNSEIVCFPQKWILCAKVFSAKCRPDSVRSIYQYVPIRRGVLIQAVAIALRARVESLVEQPGEDVDPAFGLYVLVHSSDRSFETLRIEFPKDSNDWTKRSIRYTSPPGAHVADLTIMLSCVGYAGIVSFTDIEIIPDAAENNNWLSPDAVLATCASDATVIEKSGNQFEEQFRYLNWSIESSQDCVPSKRDRRVTVAVHVSMDRITALEKSLQNWNGIVSLAVLVPVPDLTEGLSEWQRLYLEKKIKSLSLSPCSRVTLVLAKDGEVIPYPGNLLRNAVIRNVVSQFVLLIDADFQPGPELEISFLDSVDLGSLSKKAYIVPVFEPVESTQSDGAKNKAELLQLIFRDEPLLQPFQSYEAEDGYKLTNYFKWYSSSQAYPVVGFADKFEPYFIAEKAGLPLFDETFSGYGMDKVTQVTEMFAAGYSFFVLPDAWMIHFPLKTSPFADKFLRHPHAKLKNRHLRFEFLLNLFKRYNLTESHCVKK